MVAAVITEVFDVQAICQLVVERIDGRLIGDLFGLGRSSPDGCQREAGRYYDHEHNKRHEGTDRNLHRASLSQGAVHSLGVRILSLI